MREGERRHVPRRENAGAAGTASARGASAAASASGAPGAPGVAASAAATPPTDRHTRRKAETRQRLLDAASQLFAARGFEATRPQDIARAADVAVGTFYLHFEDRRAAFLAFTERAAEELMEVTRARAPEGAGFEEWLAACLGALLDYSDRKPGVLRAAFADEGVIAAGADDPDGKGASLRDRLAHGLAIGLEAGMGRGVFHADYDPLLVSYGMVGLIQQALVHGVKRPVDRATMIENITRFCGRALDVHSRARNVDADVREARNAPGEALRVEPDPARDDSVDAPVDPLDGTPGGNPDGTPGGTPGGTPDGTPDATPDRGRGRAPHRARNLEDSP